MRRDGGGVGMGEGEGDVGGGGGGGGRVWGKGRRWVGLYMVCEVLEEVLGWGL